MGVSGKVRVSCPNCQYFKCPSGEFPCAGCGDFEHFLPKSLEFEPSFEQIYSSLCNMQEAKDKKYGNSALNPLEIFSKHHPYGARIDEKLARVKNSEELRKNDIADIIGGLVLICKDKGFTNFDDLID